jgi:hypothetical protein
VSFPNSALISLPNTAIPCSPNADNDTLSMEVGANVGEQDEENVGNGVGPREGLNVAATGIVVGEGAK